MVSCFVTLTDLYTRRAVCQLQLSFLSLGAASPSPPTTGLGNAVSSPRRVRVEPRSPEGFRAFKCSGRPQQAL